MSKISEKEVEIASKAYADATGYYVEFHRGLSSPSADQIRKGVRAALEAAANARAEAAAIAREALSQGDAFSPHPDQTSPMTVGPEDYFEEPLVDRLRKRAKAAREEKNATALSDALHFEQAASDLERLQQDLVFWKANSVSESKARIAAETALAHPAVPEGLAEFAKEICRVGFEGGSLDGCDILDTAVKHGLCRITNYHPEMTGIVNAEYFEEGDAVYVFDGPLAAAEKEAE